ncbi:MAG: hypothetical protein AB8B60_11170 [Sulfitobacter sp.]
MNQCVIQTTADPVRQCKLHQLQIFEPASCGTELEKLNNARKMIKELEEAIVTAEEWKNTAQLISKLELGTAIILETSIAFLDLSAALFTTINPAAAKTAKGGVAGLKSLKSVEGYRTGAISGAELATDLGKQGLSVIEVKGTFNTVLLNSAKTHVDAVALMVKASGNSSGTDLKNDAFSFAQDEAGRSAETLGEALSEQGKSTGILNGLLALKDVYDSTSSYKSSLDARFDTYLDQTERAKQQFASEKASLKKTLITIKTHMDRAAAEFATCVSHSE